MKFLSLFLLAMSICITPILATADTLVIGEYSIKDVVCESEVKSEAFEEYRNFIKEYGLTTSFSSEGTVIFKMPSYIYPNSCKDTYSGTYRVSEKNIYAEITEAGIETVPDSEYPCPPFERPKSDEKVLEIVDHVSFKIPLENHQNLDGDEWMCGEKEDTKVHILMTLGL